MEFAITSHRRIRLALGFDDVSLVPSAATVDPRDVDVSFQLGPHSFKFPVIASAMDGVVSPSFAAVLHGLGGLGVINLEGIFTRYEKPEPVLARIAQASDEEATPLLQEVYREPVKPALIERTIHQIKGTGALAAGSLTPRATRDLGELAVGAGLDILVVQSTVTSPRYRTTKGHELSVLELTQHLKIPILVGNCVSYEVALEFMHAGIDGVLVGVGPGQACTTRAVTGVGVPQITATADVAAARDDFHESTGKYVLVVTDGGMRQGGQIAKALAAGADAVMVGSIFAGCPETPAAPYHWGMATPDPNLPRGTRVRVDKQIPVQKLLFGPSSVTDGTENLVGCVVSAMSLCGAAKISEFHQIELVFSLSFLSEGKNLQRSQRLGMGI